MELDRSVLALAALAALFALLLALERLAPLRARRRRSVSRLIANAGITITAFAAAGALVAPTAEALLGWSAETGFGLLHWIELPFALELAIGLLLLDLTFYWWHRANHAVPLLWRFHNVHHIDPDLDVTTATRFHFGEIGFSVGFRAAQVVLLGVPVVTWVAYETAFQAATFFHHSNLRLPRRLERALGLIVVGPRMHGIHHSQLRAETQSNYSVILNVWDRLHRTLRLEVPQQRVVIGVPGYDDPDDNRLVRALAAPFRRQRPYWPGQDDEASASSSARTSSGSATR